MGGVVLALPLAKLTKSTPRSAAKRWTSATNFLVIGSINADDTNRAPRWAIKKLATPCSYCNRGTYTLRCIRSMHSTSRVT